MELVHGGDWAGYEEEFHTAPLDFSANVSPLGVPDGVVKAIATAALWADKYPDPLCRALTKAIAAHEQVPPEWILCGNGAADLIFRIVLANKPRRALVTAPTFAEYEQALATVDCRVERALLREETGFAVDETFTETIKPGVDMVLLCEPNNPTGCTTPRQLLLHILERCTQVGAFLVVDECFCDFLDDPSAHTLKAELARHPNLILLRAFTKLYAMAGVRLGYLFTASVTQRLALERAGQPWSVSGLAQAAGLAALQETDYVAALRQLIAKERPWLFDHLTALGCKVLSGEANYLLLRCETPLAQPLRSKGILVRSCANYAGLGAQWYRVAVRTHAENERLLAALAQIL